MFGVEDDVLIQNLETLRRSLCGYADPDRCDCKFGATGRGEQTGCPELRQAIKILSGQRQEIFVLRQALERSAVNTLARFRELLAAHDADQVPDAP